MFKFFDLLRTTNSGAIDKFQCVNGDISEKQLGLSEPDADLLRRTVNIVIHSAATIRFNEPIKVALNINVVGTRQLLDLCREMVHLKASINEVKNSRAEIICIFSRVSSKSRRHSATQAQRSLKRKFFRQ